MRCNRFPFIAMCDNGTIQPNDDLWDQCCKVAAQTKANQEGHHLLRWSLSYNAFLVGISHKGILG